MFDSMQKMHTAQCKEYWGHVTFSVVHWPRTSHTMHWLSTSIVRQFNRGRQTHKASAVDVSVRLRLNLLSFSLVSRKLISLRAIIIKESMLEWILICHMKRGKDISIYSLTIVISGKDGEAEIEFQHWTLWQKPWWIRLFNVHTILFSLLYLWSCIETMQWGFLPYCDVYWSISLWNVKGWGRICTYIFLEFVSLVLPLRRDMRKYVI